MGFIYHKLFTDKEYLPICKCILVISLTKEGYKSFYLKKLFKKKHILTENI